ncbi:cytochrome P450 [Schizophyllum commune H4-8]|uniref:cytochrome P450 n=1 Tax=Schizophyllum commune (strain H4-8 / FGSC 9210) TaxID=578458 RepID=UPI0021607D2A|nr:cytochrome P450 [Schizophyllum commune H4-8]KAI5892518.1 cytochrome P450 [Schizophyllum commune H4-8]
MGFRATLTFLRWSPRFRMHRRLLQSALSKVKIAQYQDLQTREARRAVKSIRAHPEKWETALRRYATAIVLGAGFGVSIEEDDSPYVRMAEDASYALAHGGAPAGSLVDFLPFLRYLPTCLVPLRPLKFARKWHAAIRRIHEVPFAAVQKDIQEGIARPSLVQQKLEALTSALERSETPEMTHEDIRGAAGAIYAAGQDTTWATLTVFVLNMVLNPGIQRKAREEIDRVVGRDRLPSFSDRASMPYLNHVLLETLRWCPVSPVGVPHKSLEDDVYRDMLIPKGTIVYANARAMCYDTRVYKSPETFDPMRYAPVSDGGREEPPPVGHFGFGRRICVGRHFADATLWIIMATMLATLNFERVLDDDGQPVTPKVSLTAGLTSHPESFPCVLMPR